MARPGKVRPLWKSVLTWDYDDEGLLALTVILVAEASVAGYPRQIHAEETSPAGRPRCRGRTRSTAAVCWLLRRTTVPTTSPARWVACVPFDGHADGRPGRLGSSVRAHGGRIVGHFGVPAPTRGKLPRLRPVVGDAGNVNLAQATIDGAYIAAGAAVFGFVIS